MVFCLIQLLEDINIFRKAIWPYLTLKDICHLLKVDKNTRSICLGLNKLVSQKLRINFYNTCQENKQPSELKSIFNIFPKISKLFLSDNQIMEFEAMFVLYHNESICNSLKDLTVLITDESSNGISNLFNVEVLDISCSPIKETYNGMLIEISSMTNITSLNISNCHEIYHGVLSPLCYLTRLKYLYMDHCYGLSNYGLQHLSTLTNLEHLDLSYCTNISNEGLLHLKHLVNLKFLNLKVSAISSLSVLETLVNIETLDLSHCHLLTIHGFSSISCLTKLIRLSLYYCELLATITVIWFYTPNSKNYTLNYTPTHHLPVKLHTKSDSVRNLVKFRTES